MANSLHIVGVQFSSFTRIVQFCCEEIGLNYSLGTTVNGQDFVPRSAAIQTLHPFGKIPILLDNGKALFETQAICRYLDNHYNQSRLQPVDAWQRAQVDQWCAAITAYVDKNIIRNYILEFRFPKGNNGSVRMDVAEAAMPDIIATVKILEKQLATRQFLVGDQFTLADIMLMPALHYLSLAPNNLALLRQDSPLRDYLKNLLERPAAKKVFI